MRHMSSLEIESVVRLSDMHQQQVTTTPPQSTLAPATYSGQGSSGVSQMQGLPAHLTMPSIHQWAVLQVRSECGPDALVRTLSPSGSPLTTPLSSRRLWTPCKDMFSSSDEQVLPLARGGGGGRRFFTQSC